MARRWQGRIEASSALPGFEPAGAMEGQRYSAEAGAAWKGAIAGRPAGDLGAEGPGGGPAAGAGPDAAGWWWQIRFDTPREVGAILQVHGDHAQIVRNAPRRYVWQWSPDGMRWQDLSETEIVHERRLFRLHRLAERRRVLGLRLKIAEAEGEFPTLRAVELYEEPNARVPFDDWIVVVSTLEHDRLPGAGQEFIPLARGCPGWHDLQAQQVWLGDFDEAFVAAEPRPLCAFLSGNFKDWCQVAREPWRGTQEVLRNGHLPMWASCGGAQGLAILAEAGVDREWDCPHCRDPRNPKLSIYTHIGHTARRPCGDYSACLDERGRFNVFQLFHDPAFAGLPQEFAIMESHCGQIQWAPEGWMLIVTAGTGAKTRTQCIRVHDRYIYAAQFHIEMDGTPATSRRIMSNFLAEAKRWGGYNPEARPAQPPPFWTPSSDPSA
jgi:hypothetical protein